jgi:hypothetical protein
MLAKQLRGDMPAGLIHEQNGVGAVNWNKLVERPWLIMSIGTRQWAHG